MQCKMQIYYKAKSFESRNKLNLNEKTKFNPASSVAGGKTNGRQDLAMPPTFSESAVHYVWDLQDGAIMAIRGSEHQSQVSHRE